MGQLKLNPPTALSTRVARFSKGVANSNLKAKANGDLPGATEPPLPLTPERLELIKAYAKDPLRNADGLTASRIAQRFATRAPAAPPSGDHRSAAHTPLTAPLSALTSGIRTLTAVLVVVALLPNLTLAAFWLRVIDMPWTERVASPPSESPTPAVQSAIPRPVLSAPNTLEASVGEEVSFPIALDGTDGVPAHSIIVIRGLPQGSTLSNGYPHGETEWNLKPDEIGDLHLVLPDAAIGESELTIQLVAPDYDVIADTSTILQVAADPKANVGAFGIKTQLGEAQVSDTRAQELQPGGEESTATLDDASFSSDPMPLPTRRPAPDGSDDVHANWIKPSASVNLRERPSSSAPIVDVVAKGDKLRVIGRKRGWVQVTNPATSDRGWIYAGNVKTVH
jgi:hypothetical protein